VREGGMEGGEGGVDRCAGFSCWDARDQKAGWASWLLGRKPGEIPIGIKNKIFYFTKAFKICTRRFRRNFDMGIFPKFF
jgi:hypothetical protein